MSEKSLPNASWKFAAWALGLANLSWLVAQQFAALDRQLFELLASSFAGRLAEESFNRNYTALPPLDAILCLAAVSAAMAVTYRIAGLPRLIAFVQVFVLSLLVEGFLACALHVQTRPLEMICALAAGALTGHLLRQERVREKQMEAQYYELKLRNRELSEARLQIVKQDEVDRRILAGDLHDQVLNDLKSIKVKVEQFQHHGDSGDVTALAGSLDQLLDRAMSQIREVMDSLHPSTLEHLGFAAAVQDCLKRGGERASFKIRFKCNADEEDLSRLNMIEQSLLYRLVQEAVTNICKHAEATMVRTTIAAKEGWLVISIADDGKGMAAGERKSERGSRGLRYMRQRADLIGATIAWLSPENEKGTVVEIRLELGRKNAVDDSDS